MMLSGISLLLVLCVWSNNAAPEPLCGGSGVRLVSPAGGYRVVLYVTPSAVSVNVRMIPSLPWSVW